jgi:hypothetical protein
MFTLYDRMLRINTKNYCDDKTIIRRRYLDRLVWCGIIYVYYDQICSLL